jgi:nicotinamide riboside transporter PnuC
MDWLWNPEGLLRYFGLDFAGMVLTFASLWLVSRRRPTGFLVGAIANAAWLGFAFLAQSGATVYANLLIGALNLVAWRRWQGEARAGR